MAVTIGLNLTEMYDFDSITDVTASQGSPALDLALLKEGVGSIAAELWGAGIKDMYYTRPSGTWDVSNSHIYIWFYCIHPNLDTKANGGIRIRVGDGSNVGYWYVGGSDTYGGGWICLVIDTSKSLDFGSCTLTAVTSIGIAINITSSFKNVETTWVDIARFGDGITITSDATCTMDNILAVSENTTNASGIIRKEGGVFFVQGKLRFGDASGTSSITFEDNSEIVVFEDKDVASTLYEIIIQGNATGTTSVKFGTKSGSRGISGFVFKSAGMPRYLSSY